MGKGKWVTDCVFGNNEFVTAGTDNTIKFWTKHSKRPTTVLAPHESWVTRCDLSADHSTVASGTKSGVVRVWNVTTKTSLTIAKVSHSLQTLRISRDSTLVVGGHHWCSVWPVGAFHLEAAHTLNSQNLVTSCDIIFDNRFLCTSDVGGIVTVWDTETAKPLVVRKLPALVASASFSSDGSQIATGCADGVVRIFDSRSQSNPFKLSGHRKAIHDCCFTSDATKIVSCGSRVRVWDTATGKLITKIKPDAQLEFVRCSVSDDGDTVVVVSAKGKVVVASISLSQPVGFVTRHNHCRWLLDDKAVTSDEEYELHQEPHTKYHRGILRTQK